MAHSLPQLSYSPEALEPHIDARTMEIHHGKHHQTYINNLNAALEGHDSLADVDLSELIRDLSSLPEEIRPAVRNNGGGHSNHTFFWQCLSPNGGGLSSGPLGDAINSTFGSLDSLKDQFKKAALTRFGSGWAWLVKRSDGSLVVSSTPNQDSPYGRDCRRPQHTNPWSGCLGTCLLLRYQNRRPDYVDAFWEVVDWSFASSNFSNNYNIHQMNRISLLFLFLLGSIQFSYGQAANFVKGAVIVLESKGLVQASDSTGKLITNGLSTGTVLSDGFSLSTGLSGQLTILLSNGIVATIEPESKLSLLTFLQKSFEPNNLTLDSMDKEPTESITKIVVEYGSVIFVSKAIPNSQFEISTQAGTTKILGNAFRIEQDALGVSKVDVTIPPFPSPTGKGQPILLTEGKGLDVTTDGIALKEVDASVNKLVNEVIIFSPNYLRRFPSYKEAVNKAQGLSPTPTS